MKKQLVTEVEEFADEPKHFAQKKYPLDVLAVGQGFKVANGSYASLYGSIKNYRNKVDNSKEFKIRKDEVVLDGVKMEGYRVTRVK